MRLNGEVDSLLGHVGTAEGCIAPEVTLLAEVGHDAIVQRAVDPPATEATDEDGEQPDCESGVGDGAESRGVHLTSGLGQTKGQPATPQQRRESARCLGKRLRLAHVTYND